MNQPSDELLFSEEPVSAQASRNRAPWKILIVDDEPMVHEVTTLSLDDLALDGRGIEFISAFSAEQAKEQLARHDDIAVILLDVVMETEHAGLDLTNHIRRNLGNHLSRIILRTGQPGQAPERQVILEYDINDYKEKTELSSSKLYSSVITALRNYRDLNALDKNRRGLEQIITASRSLYDTLSLEQFITGVLMQLEALVGQGDNSFFSKAFGVMGHSDEDPIESLRIIAGTGEFARLRHRPLSEAIQNGELETIKKARDEHRSVVLQDAIVVDLLGPDGNEGLLYLSGAPKKLDEVDRRLLDVFTSNASMALNNLYLNQEIEFTQREIIFTLGEIAEFRSRETSRHVARMSKAAELLARLLGMDEDECNIVMLAASMHDMGKIAIPDAILSKPGRLEPEEWELMKTHAELGYKLLNGSKRPLMRAAATIAREHHEKWDGSGYPRGLSGHNIHLYGRIAAIADVFDALGNHRCYKHAWDAETIVAYFREQKGGHFDPELTDIFLDNRDRFFAIRDDYGDISK